MWPLGNITIRGNHYLWSLGGMLPCPPKYALANIQFDEHDRTFPGLFCV